MKKLVRFLSMLALIGAILGSVSVRVLAQGGASRHGGKYSLIFDYAPPINGKSSICKGTYGLTTYITTLSLDIRVSSCNLPDGTPLTVAVYAKDYYNGKPWTPKVAGTMTLVSHAATLSVSSLWTTPAGGLPVITSVVITSPNGTVVLSGHP